MRLDRGLCGRYQERQPLRRKPETDRAGERPIGSRSSPRTSAPRAFPPDRGSWEGPRRSIGSGEGPVEPRRGQPGAYAVLGHVPQHGFEEGKARYRIHRQGQLSSARTMDLQGRHGDEWETVRLRGGSREPPGLPSRDRRGRTTFRRWPARTGRPCPRDRHPSARASDAVGIAFLGFERFVRRVRAEHAWKLAARRRPWARLGPPGHVPT